MRPAARIAGLCLVAFLAIFNHARAETGYPNAAIEQQPGTPSAGPQYKALIYLSFDDGPYNGTTNVLKVLQEEKAPASFFIVGRHGRRPARAAIVDLLRREPLVTLANHSYTHASEKYAKFYSSPKIVLADMAKATQSLNLPAAPIHARLPGRNVYRLPGVARNDGGLRKHVTKREKTSYDQVAAAGYYIYGWDLEWNYRGSRPKQSARAMLAIVELLIKQNRTLLPKKVMILAHDFMFGRKRSIAELRLFIRLLRKNGYHIAHLATYAGAKAPPATSASTKPQEFKPH